MGKDEGYKRNGGGKRKHGSTASGDDEEVQQPYYPKKKKHQTVVSLQAFARGKKGAIKALHSYRERKDKKRLHTAKALRQYKKAMASEGYEPGQGASRKRGPRRTSTEHEEAQDGNEAVESTNRNQMESNDHASSQEAAAASRMKHSDNGNYHKKKNHHHHDDSSHGRPPAPHPSPPRTLEEREKERRQKIRARKQRTAKLRQRTRNGQPIMQNLVHDILHKLEKEKQQQQEKEQAQHSSR